MSIFEKIRESKVFADFDKTNKAITQLNKNPLFFPFNDLYDIYCNYLSMGVDQSDGYKYEIKSLLNELGIIKYQFKCEVVEVVKIKNNRKIYRPILLGIEFFSEDDAMAFKLSQE